MAGRRTNLALFGLLAVAFATGALAYAVGTGWARWVVIGHGASGLGLLLLTPWKSMVVQRGIRHHPATRTLSIAFGVLVVITIAAGIVHSAGLRVLGPVTAMQVHVGAALVALPLALWHVAARPTRPRRTDLSRRNALRTAGLVGGAGALWVATEGLWQVTSLRGADRRFTGSHEVGSFQPSAMPVTQWLSDSVPSVDTEDWRLRVEADGEERTWAYEDLLDFDDEVRATLDCTGGWYAEQDWRGVRLARLLPDQPDGDSLVVSSVTGYWRRYPLGDAPRLLLATRVGGEPLSRGHGFPVRIVAPGRRGFWWVKWVDSVRTSSQPPWWQPPYPLQ